MIDYLLGIFTVLFFSLVISAILKDDSDKNFFTRSGMSVYTDYKTGLQYLGGSKGGIIPRLDENGKHIKIK